MKKFYLHHDRIEIILANGQILNIRFTTETGKIVFRYKLQTISGVRHPGIVLGIDDNGQRWIIHNHYLYRRPVLETEIGFAKYQQLFYADQQPQIEYLAVIQNAMDEVQLAKSYHWLNYNCQSFVNKVCFNQLKSESIEKWIGGVALGLLVLLGIGALNNSK